MTFNMNLTNDFGHEEEGVDVEIVVAVDDPCCRVVVGYCEYADDNNCDPKCASCTNGYDI